MRALSTLTPRLGALLSVSGLRACLTTVRRVLGDFRRLRRAEVRILAQKHVTETPGPRGYGKSRVITFPGIHRKSRFISRVNLTQPNRWGRGRRQGRAVERCGAAGAR